MPPIKEQLQTKMEANEKEEKEEKRKEIAT